MNPFEICDYCKDNLQVLWAISVGRLTVHMYSNLSELIELRDKVDEMIDGLEKIKKEKDLETKIRRERIRR
jgi:hypothetical protein